MAPGERTGPEDPGETRADQTIACPFCASTKIEEISPFGSQLLTSQHRCLTCGTYFEAVRDDR